MAAGILVLAPRGDGGVAATVEVTARHLPEARVRPLGGGPWSAPRALRALFERPRVLHVHSSFRARSLARDAPLVAAARLLGGTVVWQFHGTDGRLRDDPPGWVLRAASGVVVTSVDPGLVDALVGRGVDAQEVGAAVDLAALPDPSERSPEPGLVVFLGRRTEAKGLGELLASRRRWPANARLVVCGDGPLRMPSDVEARGWVGPAERRSWLTRAHVVVLPSRSEGAPLAVAEAIVSGVPVVASGGQGVRALVGGAGSYLAEVDPDRLGDAVAAALTGPGTVDVSEVERVRRRVDPEVVAAQWRATWDRAEVSAARARR